MTVSTSERLGVEAFQALFDRCSNWGRWGPDDERGALNLITPQKSIQAAALVQEGATVSVSHPVNTVGDAENTSPAVHLMVRAGDVFDGVTVTLHRGSPRRLTPRPGPLPPRRAVPLRLAGQDVQRPPRHRGQLEGARTNAITIGQDGIVSRGVLLDVPRQRGVDCLEPDQSITVADLEATEKAQGVAVESGDILLVRTGPTRHAQGRWPVGQPSQPLRAPPRRAPLAQQRGVALLGCDGVSDFRPHAFDCCPTRSTSSRLVAMGMQLLDNQNLDDLAAACAERTRWEFMLVIAPLKLVGGTASMTNPIAIF